MKNSEPKASMVSKSIETYLKTAIVFLILYASFLIFKPFLLPIVWGAILAIALFPLHKKISKLLGGKKRLSAVLITLIFLALIILPSFSFVSALVSEVKDLFSQISNNTLEIQAPPEKVAQWPVIGKSVYKIWDLFAQNMRSAFDLYSDQIKNMASWAFHNFTGITETLLIFVVAVIIAGVFLNASSKGFKTTYDIGTKLVGKDGPEIIDSIVKTVRSVMTGVLGTAVIQTLIISIAFFVFDVPLAPILSLVVLFMAIAQLPVILLILPVIIYMFSVLSGFSAVLFTVWMLLGALSDNIIKPILLGRGTTVPMLVILIGAIGGMLLMGIIGLFIGAVILSTAYELLQWWLADKFESNAATEIQPGEE